MLLRVTEVAKRVFQFLRASSDFKDTIKILLICEQAKESHINDHIKFFEGSECSSLTVDLKRF